MSSNSSDSKKVEQSAGDGVQKPVCGLVMPISAIDGYSEQHWIEVKRIISEAVEPKGFTLRMVSDADESGIIQRRIVQNLYENEVVVCDVSSKNPNVMFELGLRLAFDKPTIVIKDDVTNYSFDTSPIENIGYPRDLRYSSIVQFKERLAVKVDATYSAFKADPEYSTFLKSFGEYRVAKLEQKDVSKEAYIISALDDLNQQLKVMRRDTRALRGQASAFKGDSDSGLLDALIKDAIVDFLSVSGSSELPVFVSEEEERRIFDHLESKPSITRLAGSPGRLRAAMSSFVNPF